MTENDRLVHQHANGYIKPTQYGHTRYWSYASKFAMMNRLGEYEDTGLTPDEIMALLDGETNEGTARGGEVG